MDIHGHSYSAPKMSPSKTIKKLSTQVRTLQQKVRRRNKKIESIKQLLNTLKREQLVDSEQSALLHNNFGNMAKELFNNQLKNASCSSGQSRRYADVDNNVNNNVDNHFFDHHISQERDHLTSLLRLVVKRYLNLRLKTYGKKYTEMIAHKNLPSSRHELTKTILFVNQ